MMRLRHLIDDLNIGTFNPVGLNILWPRNVAFLYVRTGFCFVLFFFPQLTGVSDSLRLNIMLVIQRF